MLYLGGKGRLGRTIASVVLAHTERRETYVEPFLGGGNTFRFLAPHFREAFAGDAHEDLMLMWEAAVGGWVPPCAVSETEYSAARASAPSPLRGFIGFGCSYGGKWWGGYARNKVVGMRERSHPDYYARLASKDVCAVARLLTAATVARLSFEEWAPVVTGSTVVYADPPYAKTTGYKGGFDHATFWQVMAQWADSGAAVYVSEYSAPAGWEPIWSKDQPRKVSGGSGKMTRENLFVRSSTR